VICLVRRPFCDLSAIDHNAADALARVLNPGDPVLSVESPRPDLVAVHVRGGPENWILWLQHHDKGWDKVEKPAGEQ